MKENKTANFFLECGVLGYLLTVLFNGYLRHVGLSVELLQWVRPFLPEVFIAMVILAWMLNGAKILMRDMHFWLYVLAVCILSVGSAQSSTAVLSVVRDLFEPMVVLSIVSVYRLSSRETARLMAIIRTVLAFFVIVGCFFAVHQRLMGWEWTSKYFAGYSFWGVNREESLRITYSWLGFKSLGTTGSAETFGFYNAFAVIFFLYYGYRRAIFNSVIIILAIVNLLCSGMKTPFIIVLVILFVVVFLPRRKNLGLILQSVIVLVTLFVVVYMLLDSEDWTETSLYARIVLWRELLQTEHLINLVFPHNLFGYSAGAGNTGITNFWDSSYFYVAYSLGIAGLLLLLRCIYMRYKWINGCDRNDFMMYSILFLALSSITTCLFMGRNVITCMFVVFGIRTANAREMLCR